MAHRVLTPHAPWHMFFTQPAAHRWNPIITKLSEIMAFFLTKHLFRRTVRPWHAFWSYLCLEHIANRLAKAFAQDWKKQCLIPGKSQEEATAVAGDLDWSAGRFPTPHTFRKEDAAKTGGASKIRQVRSKNGSWRNSRHGHWIRMQQKQCVRFWMIPSRTAIV